MSRVILIAALVALAICYADCKPGLDKHGCSANMVWDECPDLCQIWCSVPDHIDCGVRNCDGRCVCKPGYFLTKDGHCVFKSACY